MVDIVALAKEVGFDQVGAIDASDVVTSAELSAACNPQACEKYNTCWTCQPAAGPFEEIREAHITSKKAGVIVQTVRDNIDYWEDWELVAETRTLHNDRLDRLAAMLREEFDGVLEFSTGGCDVCGECSYPDAPCKRPDLHLQRLLMGDVFQLELFTLAGKLQGRQPEDGHLHHQ